MPVLSGRSLAKAYGLHPLFADADLTIRRGEKVALVGPNGAGKSTLLRVLAGLEPADSGAVDRRRGAVVAYLAQEPELDPARSPRELVREALSKWHEAKVRYDEVTARIEQGDVSLSSEQARLAEEVERLGGWSRDHEIDQTLDHLGVLDKDRPVETMSGGERRRVALARILVARPDLAILDEPTNHLDTETVQWLEEHLQREFEGAVLIVTHDRYVLDAVATRVLELEGGKLVEYTKRDDHLGAFADWMEQKAERLAHEERVEQNRQNFLRREVEWLRRGPKARTTKQKARIHRAEAAIAVAAPRERERVGLEGMEDGASRLGGTVLELRDVGVRLGERELLRGLTLHLARGDRVGIVGPNGAGKTSLLRVVAGELAPTSGEVVRGRQTKIAYFDQARARLEDGWSVFDNVAGHESAERSGTAPITIGDREMTLRAYLELFLFDGHAQRRKVAALSGGERARVSLALALKEGANVLMLDEPTNDLDIDTLGALEDMLERWQGSVLVVSHDRFFLDRVATAILALEGDGAATLYAGNWSSYHERKVERAAERAAAKVEAKAATAAEVRSASPPAAGTKKLTYAERIELDEILDVIAAAETRAAELEAKLSDPTVWSRPEEAKQLRADLHAASAEVARLLARWEDLEKRRG